MAAVQLVAAIGADDQQALVAQAAQQRGQELERGAIGPVQVLDDEQDGQLGGQPIEQPAEHPEQAGLCERVAGVVVAIVPPRGRAPIGHDPRQLGVTRPDERREGVRIELAREASQRRGDRRVGQLAGAEGRAFAAHHARAAIGRAPLDLAHQPRLADAGLAAHERCARRAAPGPLERGLEQRELRGAPDELRAGDARWHAAIISARR